MALSIMPASAEALTVRGGVDRLVPLSAEGEYLPLNASCRGYIEFKSCRVSLSVSRALIKSRLGLDSESREVTIGRARVGSAGRSQLMLEDAGRALLQSQPGGIKVRLRLKARSRSGKTASLLKIFRLRLSDKVSLPQEAFQPGQPKLDPAGSRAIKSLAQNLPGEVSALTCTGVQAPVAMPERPRGRRAARLYKRLLVNYKQRVNAERSLASSRARIACRRLAKRVKSLRVKVASTPGPEGVSLDLRYPRSTVDMLPKLGVHSMIQPGMTAEEISQTMAASHEAGMSMVRFDLPINYIGQYLHVAPGMYDFSFLDQVREEAQRQKVELLAIATWAPQPMTDCPGEDGYKCPPRDPQAWASILQAAAQRAPEINYFEIWNEPNTRFFKGSQADYVGLLKAASAALRAQSADNRVVIGGPASLGISWLSEVLPQVQGDYDVAAVHVRPSTKRAGQAISRAREVFKASGFEGPLWVTEFGYPTRAEHQYDKKFQLGESSQSDYYLKALSRMKQAGVDRVFVTGRDAPEYGEDSPFSSEGLWSFSEGSLTFKPAYWRLAEAG